MPMLSELLAFDSRAPLLFTSGQFLFWLTLFFPGLVLLRRSRLRVHYVAAFSCFFFYKSSGALLAALLFTCAADFAIAKQLARSETQRARRAWLAASLLLSLGLLAYFKYGGWARGAFGWLTGGRFDPVELVAPAGISFYTFESVSYMVDVYRRRLPPCYHFGDYLAYLAFFPHLMAGPIVRAEELLPALRRPSELTAERLGSGLLLVLSGLLHKAVLSDYLARYADVVFGGGEGLSGVELALGVYAYAGQIYCDFAGYSQMALGLGRWCGVELPLNFHAPYAAVSLTDFWRRWHLTLSRWLRDYVYVPLGGNRHGRARTLACLLATMLLGGLWHGASLSFVVWGLVHGLLLCGEKLLAEPLARLHGSSVGRSLARLFTFHCVALLWVPFRAGSFEESLRLLSRILGQLRLSELAPVLSARWPLLLATALALFFGATTLEPFERLGKRLAALPLPLRAAVALAAVQLTLQLRDTDVPPFIYFRF